MGKYDQVLSRQWCSTEFGRSRAESKPGGSGDLMREENCILLAVLLGCSSALSCCLLTGHDVTQGCGQNTHAPSQPICCIHLTAHQCIAEIQVSALLHGGVLCCFGQRGRKISPKSLRYFWVQFSFTQSPS